METMCFQKQISTFVIDLMLYQDKVSSAEKFKTLLSTAVFDLELTVSVLFLLKIKL